MINDNKNIIPHKETHAQNTYTKLLASLYTRLSEQNKRDHCFSLLTTNKINPLGFYDQNVKESKLLKWEGHYRLCSEMWSMRPLGFAPPTLKCKYTFCKYTWKYYNDAMHWNGTY